MFTAVQAPNGAGKTPIMKGVMQGLGHEVDLPPDVLSRCEFAQVELSVDERPVTLTRRLGAEFEMHINDGLNQQAFTNQAEYARWFSGLFSADLPNLTSKQSQPAELYATVLLPALWVDQDHGWTTDYWTPPYRNFIRDQRQEVVRFLVGLPPRHPFRPKTEFEAAKRSLDRTERALEMQRFVVDRLRTNEQLSDNEEPGLIERRLQLRQELEINSEAIAAIRSSSSFYNQEIEALETQRHEWTVRANSLNKQKGSSISFSRSLMARRTF